ncbi:glutathione S-transferase [Acinetobacter cumulans]|uniref:Glutathione S-transferase n=1 Tax=Acinetobacter cumulans TaxID=2136182 RepID=A0A3A8GAV5_9GAMM|nr:glutathione S-transferase [Acinetobacter cumulans]RKG52134.1 glutathione S-transferase [Acinetobacter cumulans]
MLRLHHLEKSRSFRILWALEELNLDYQVKYYPRQADYSGSPELKKIHTLGKAPVLEHDGVVIAESAVILEHVQAQFDTASNFKPTELSAQQQYRYWMHYAEGSLMPLLVMTLVMEKMPTHVPWPIRPIAKKIGEGVKAGFVGARLPAHIEFIEQHLAQHDYFADDFSFADIQMSFPLIALQERTGRSYPQIQAYVERLKQRPAYQRALQKERALEQSGKL